MPKTSIKHKSKQNYSEVKLRLYRVQPNAQNSIVKVPDITLKYLIYPLENNMLKSDST